MKRFAFLINDGSSIIKLEEFLDTTTGSRMVIRNVDVYWDLKNIEKDTSINYGADIQFKRGYYTFEDLQKKLKDADITLTLNKYDGTCTIFGEDHPIKLKDVGPVLGFKLNQTIPANTSTTSTSKVSVNNGIEFLALSCNIANISKNYFNGKRSQVIACLPISSTQNLFGTVSHYSNRYSAIPLYKPSVSRVP